MGAHSLGKTTKANSGYEGSWTPGRENVFDNEFHSVLETEIQFFFNKVCFYIIVLLVCIIILSTLNIIWTSSCAPLNFL